MIDYWKRELPTWHIDYTYECWKCPDRHSAVYTVEALDADLAVMAWRGDLLGDFYGAHDYDLLVIDIRKETK
tara:strand:- start:131 stop:346 length:216 start_codon:yes stop_codon:yes gene_type:complete